MWTTWSLLPRTRTCDGSRVASPSGATSMSSTRNGPTASYVVVSDSCVVSQTVTDYLHEVPPATIPVTIHLQPVRLGRSWILAHLVLKDAEGQVCTTARTRYVAWDMGRWRRRARRSPRTGVPPCSRHLDGHVGSHPTRTGEDPCVASRALRLAVPQRLDVVTPAQDPPRSSSVRRMTPSIPPHSLAGERASNHSTATRGIILDRSHDRHDDGVELRAGQGGQASRR